MKMLRLSSTLPGCRVSESQSAAVMTHLNIIINTTALAIRRRWRSPVCGVGRNSSKTNSGIPARSYDRRPVREVVVVIYLSRRLTVADIRPVSSINNDTNG